jgi:rubrerythrin
VVLTILFAEVKDMKRLTKNKKTKQSINPKESAHLRCGEELTCSTCGYKVKEAKNEMIISEECPECGSIISHFPRDHPLRILTEDLEIE